MLMLIWRNISRRRIQSVLTVTITLLTVAVFVISFGVWQTMRQGLALSRERLGADAVLLPKYAAVDGGDLLFSSMPQNIYMPAQVIAQAAQMDGVAAASPQFYVQTLALSCCDPESEVRIIGFDAETDFILKPYLNESLDTIGNDELILGSYFDEDYVGNGFLALGRRFLVIDQLQPTGTGMDSTVFIPIDVARELCLESAALNEIWMDKDPEEYVSVVMIKLKDGVDPKDFAKQVEASDMNAKCILTGDAISDLQKQLDVTMKVLCALLLAYLLIAALSLLGRFSALAKERKKEIGLLRAIGMQKHQVFILIIGEACTMALIGGILGSTLALLCVQPAIEALREVFKLSPSVWSLPLALLCGGAGVLLAGLLGFMAALIPAAKSASLDPQTAITQGEVA